MVVLIGPGASGKSTWAAANFPPNTVVSSDQLRALVGSCVDDIAASADAFSVLDDIVRKRMARRLTTVIDTLGLDTDRRRSWLALARQHGVPCVAVAFDTPAAECRERNRGRAKRIPADVLTAQLRTWREVRGLLPTEGYDSVLAPQAVRVVPKVFAAAAAAAQRQSERPTSLRFGLQLGTFVFPGGAAETATRIREIASAAESTGVDAIYVMDHFRQIPQVGRAFDDFLESFTTLAYLAAATERLRLGPMVTPLARRRPVKVARETATLDRLSGGRLILGVGSGYQPYEFERFGVDISRNLEMTNEVCDILDLAFSRDFFSYDGKHYRMPETHIPARPVQNPLPIYVAGHTQAMFRTAARHGYRVLTSGRVGGARFLAEQYADIVAAFAAENAPLSRAHITLNRFAHITDSREDGMRFAENARYQTRLASSLRRRQEVMQGTVLVDVPFPDEPPLETIYDNLLIGDVETVAEKLAAEIGATRPVHVCFSFKVGSTPHRAAMRSMELMIGEVKPRLDKALGIV
jgi:alkanesulfonate monooxygenase SsuD/methylene tetrahydromethanopterin reductase-like flavin-dependent oxidoreductase (luciferase family)/predicted kinase